MRGRAGGGGGGGSEGVGGCVHRKEGGKEGRIEVRREG